MTDDEIMRALVEEYREMANAFTAKDLDAVASKIASDWVGTVGDQTVTRDELMGHVRDQFRDWEDIRWDRTLSSLRRAGELATVRADGVYRARERGSGKPIEMHLVNDDTWRLSASGWQTVRSVAVQ